MLRQRGTAIVMAMLLTAAGAAAQSQAARIQAGRAVPEEYIGTTTNLVTGSGSKLVIQVLEWSSESDRKQVLSLLQTSATEERAGEKAGEKDAGKPPEDLTKQLNSIQSAGAIWADGALGYSIKYAHRVTLPNGGERVTLVTDRPLGVWDRSGPWKVTGQTSEGQPFTIVELRLNKNGEGAGKMSLGTLYTINDADQTIGLTEYDKATVTLKDVKRQPKPYWARGS